MVNRTNLAGRRGARIPAQSRRRFPLIDSTFKVSFDTQLWSNGCCSEPQSISRTSGAAARRFELTYNGLTAEDCLSATTQTLLRERYRELSAVYTRMKRVVDPETTGQFVLENTEGNGDIASRVHNLNRCIAYHVREVECLRAVINGNMELKAKWKCGSRNASLFTCGGE